MSALSRLNLWRRRQIGRFLGLFDETKRSRRDRTHWEGMISAERQARCAAERDLAAKTGKITSLEADLALAVEARANGLRELSVLRGELDAVREISEKRAVDLQKVTDCFAIRVLGRQIYGVAPEIEEKLPPEDSRAAEPLSGRAASRALAEQFLMQAREFGMRPPADGAEYSSERAQ